MQRNFKDPKDIKIFILYLLKNLDAPLSFEDLNDITVQDEFVKPMDFAQCISELEETGNVSTEEKDGTVFYSVTEQGKKVADAMESEISGYVRTKSLQNAVRFLSFKDRGIRIYVTTSPRPDGKFDMTFAIKEKEEVLMQVALIADNAYQASKMSMHFQSQPEIVYRSVLSLLSGDANYVKP